MGDQILVVDSEEQARDVVAQRLREHESKQSNEQVGLVGLAPGLSQLMILIFPLLMMVLLILLMMLMMLMVMAPPHWLFPSFFVFLVMTPRALELVYIHDLRCGTCGASCCGVRNHSCETSVRERSGNRGSRWQANGLYGRGKAPFTGREWLR